MVSPRFTPGARAQAALVLALVATIGALIGILGDRLVAQQRADTVREPMVGGPMGPGPAGPGAMRGVRYSDRLMARIDLTGAQRAAIDSILAAQQAQVAELTRQVQPQFRAIAEQTRMSVEAVLTPDQLRQLRELRSERMRRLGEERRQLRDVRPRGMPGGPPRP